MSASKKETAAMDAIVMTIRFLWRWHSGYPLHGPHGKFRTDATWSKDAKNVLHPIPGGYAPRWHHLRWRRRGLYRSAATWTVIGAIYGYLTAPAVTLAIIAAATAAAAGYGTWKAIRVIRTWQSERHEIRPLKARLKHLTGWEPVSITIVREDNPGGKDWRELKIVDVEIEWPVAAQLGPRDQPLILEGLTDRLAIEAPEQAGSKFKGRNRVVRYVQSEPPPGLIGWDHVAEAVAGADRNELVFGLGRPEVTGNRKTYAIVKASLSTDSPHLACSGGTGGGKTNLGALIILQELHRGAILFNIDPRWDSHLWSEGLPNVISAHSIPDVHNALAWLGEELHRRYQTVFYASRGTGRARPKWARILVNCEELNFGMQDLKDYWTECRAGDKSLPKRSPALKALQALSCAGRAVDIHIMLWAQMLTVECTGVKDSTVRANAGIKAMVRYDTNNWNMQIGKRFPMPPEPTEPGRIQLVTARGVQETQVPYLCLDQDKGDEEGDKAVAWAREYAVSGQVAALPTGKHGIPQRLWPVPIAEPVLGQLQLSQNADSTPGQNPETPRTVSTETPAIEAPVTLSEACDEETGFLTCGLIAARRASTRPGFPPSCGHRGAAKLYWPADLRAKLARPDDTSQIADSDDDQQDGAA